uniref:dynein axonemal intermediate chain 7 n=1 Tax=Pristiophorus japonicus TaxID=55135 RepID=UPI00398F63D6
MWVSLASKQKKKKLTSAIDSASSRLGQRLTRSEEKLLKQEEERKRLEEEQLRQAAEILEQERLERLRLEAEERARIEAADIARKENELPELIQVLEKNRLAAQKVYKNLREVTKWQRYMKCDGTPDPTVPQEINTFINLFKEDPNVDIKSLFERGRTILQLLEELEIVLSDTPADELPEATAAQYQQTIWDLQDLLSDTNDKATVILLQKAVDLVDIETGNMQEVAIDEHITLCLWANFNKNPRFKGYGFDNEHMAFELPRHLAMSDIAVRILHTQYDHISCRTPSFYAHRRAFKNKPVIFEIMGYRKEDEVVETEAEVEELLAVEEQPAVEEQEALEEKQSLEAKLMTDEDAQIIRVSRSPSAFSTSSKDEAKSQTPSMERIMDIDIKLPSVAPIQEIPSAESVDECVVDFKQYTPLGGVYYFDVLKLPPQPKFVKGWRIVQLSETGLECYPCQPGSTRGDTSTLGSTDERESENFCDSCAGIVMKLPPKAWFFEQPKPARWNPIGKQWRTDGFHFITFDPLEELLSFKMDTFNIFTLIQRYHINMPFQSWEIRPLAENEAILTVDAFFTKVEIRIKDLCQLCPVPLEDNLSHIRGKWMTASALIISMINAGLNIFPGAESEKYIRINRKNKQLELDMYTQMALVISAMAFKWSKWNLFSDYEEIIFQACENLNGEMVADDDWSVYMSRTERSHKLKMKESSEELSNEIAENAELYSNLYHMMKGVASDAAKERILNTNHLFFTSVNEMLEATKLFSHTMQDH